MDGDHEPLADPDQEKITRHPRISGPGSMSFVGEDGQTVKMATAYIPVSHEALLDSGRHTCGPQCPPPATMTGAASRTADLRFRLRRYWHPWWWRLTHVHEFRIVHRSEIREWDE